MTERFWIEWPSGKGHTGPLTDSKRLADSYAREHDGTARPESELADYERNHPFQETTS